MGKASPVSFPPPGTLGSSQGANVLNQASPVAQIPHPAKPFLSLQDLLGSTPSAGGANGGGTAPGPSLEQPNPFYGTSPQRLQPIDRFPTMFQGLTSY